MARKKQLSLPSNFADIIDLLGDSVSVAEIEAKIIEHATQAFTAKWGSIKYYYGEHFINGYSTVPPRLRLRPRKRGFMFKSVSRNTPQLMNKKVLHESHPEASPELKSILIAPLRMDENTFATISMIDDKDRTLSEKEVVLLDDFGTVYGRVLKMAHKFAAEKRANINRDKFMSFASHEIKNPLMALTSYIHLIKRSLEKNIQIKTDLLEKMSDETARIRSLIDELLNVRQSHEGELTYSPEPISLRTLLTEVFDNFKVRYPKRKLDITYQVTDEKLEIMADSVKLNQAFINLLNNAHKFSSPKTVINVTIASKNDKYVVNIIDQGIGISADEVPFIFKEYYRGSNGEHKKGIGVGLFLVKSIIENHSGTISVKSTLGKGTTFIVTLPQNR